jgi:integrase/recombinase XerD
MSVKISVILDTRRMKSDKKFPVKLRIRSNRVTEYYPTVFDLSKEDWKKIPAKRITSDLQKVKDCLKEIEVQAENAAKEILPFNFFEFEEAFIKSRSCFRQRKRKGSLKREIKIEFNGSSNDFDYSPFYKKFPILCEAPAKPGLISYSYLSYIRQLLREGRISSAVSYHCSYVSLCKFRGNIPFAFITVSYLTEYENWLKQQGLSRTTIGIYLRPLRAIFNEAIEGGIIKREKCYPFGKRKYRIPTSKNTKKALELADIQKIYYYQCDPEQPGEQNAKDYWLFSYLGNGINPKDIANLKYKNIEGDYLTFERSKTEKSLRSDPKPITIFLTDDLKTIIERWGNKKTSLNNYIFPILEPGLSPLRQYELIQNFVGFINDWMRRILKNLSINKKATTYVARHSFSTVLKRSGASTEFIQEALGHTDLKTTESYLDSFDKDVKKEFAQRLISFKKESIQ